MQPRRIRFLFLSAFSFQGGIEQFNRALIKATSDFDNSQKYVVEYACLYDDINIDHRYLKNGIFIPFYRQKWKYVLANISSIFRTDVLVIGHINLSLFGVIFKLFYPKKRMIVICHGIEVFHLLKGVKKKLLQLADNILAVSAYTKNKLIDVHNLSASKIDVFPNTLDPFFKLPISFKKPDHLLLRYGLTQHQKIILTIARIKYNEGYKGYDQVVRCLPKLIQNEPDIKYLIVGRYDQNEKDRILHIAKELNVEKHILFTGFVATEELSNHYLLADLFVMPSKAEGFGIVFIEAMACGLPVIAGNKDGSTEALQFGELGRLVDPDNLEELYTKINYELSIVHDPKEIQRKMLRHFYFPVFDQRAKQLFFN